MQRERQLERERDRERERERDREREIEHSIAIIHDRQRDVCMSMMVLIFFVIYYIM